MYFIYFALVWEKLYPPHLRKALHMAWGYVLTKPLQYLRDITFELYKDGSPYQRYDSLTNYVIGDRIYWSDRCVYEALSANIGIDPTDAVIWRKIVDNRIGVLERVRYNSQKMIFEYGLNRWFDIDSGDPQIYITRNSSTTSFLLGGQTGLTSSVLVNNSAYATSYLSNTFTYNAYNYTIYVPIAVYTALASNNTDRENVIRSFADRYNLAGMRYNVVSY